MDVALNFRRLVDGCHSLPHVETSRHILMLVLVLVLGALASSWSDLAGQEDFQSPSRTMQYSLPLGPSYAPSRAW